MEKPNQSFQVKNGEVYFEESLNFSDQIVFESSTILSQGTTEEVMNEPGPRIKEKRSCQNGIRSLNRAIPFLTMGALKIQSFDSNVRDTKIPLLLVNLYILKGEFECLKKQLNILKDSFGESKKDIKKMKMVTFLLQVTENDFTNQKIEDTFKNWGKSGQNKSHPQGANFTLQKYIEMRNRFL